MHAMDEFWVASAHPSTLLLCGSWKELIASSVVSSSGEMEISVRLKLTS
jgi:hypothetical protein